MQDLMSTPHQELQKQGADFIKKLKPKYVKDGKTGERKRMR